MSKMDIVIRKRRIPVWVWAPVGIVALGLIAYFGVWQAVEGYFFPNNWGVVEAGRIYRGGIIKPNLVKETLREHGIRVVIALNGFDPADPDSVALEQAVKDLDIELKRFPMRGNGTPGDANAADGQRKYASAVAAIVEARKESKPVLVQCGAGTHRTGGIVATYRVLVEKRPAREAYAELCDYGWNPRKHQALLDFLNPNLPAIARLLVEMGAIEAVPDPMPVLGP